MMNPIVQRCAADMLKWTMKNLEVMMYLSLLEWIDRLLVCATLTTGALLAIGLGAWFDVPYTVRLWWFIQRGIHGLL